MKRFEILSVKLSKYQGASAITFEPNGEDFAVYGDNATGKTTLANAIYWNLFDKDSENRKDFGIKTLDETGAAIPMQKHEVQLHVRIDGKAKVLTKTYEESWTRKRGTTTDTFDGHSTSYKIDDVPTSKTEFEREITQICEPTLFRALMDPLFASNQMKWDKLRELFLRVCGDVSDEGVIELDPELSELPEILEGRSLESYRKIIAARQTAINDELKKIPPAVAALRPLADAGEPFTGDLMVLRTELDQLNGKRSLLIASSAREQVGKRLAMAKGHLSAVEQIVRSENDTMERTFNTLFDEACSERASINRKITSNKGRATSLESEKVLAVEKRERLVKVYESLKAEKFVSAVADTCPTCDRPLPAEQVEEANKKALASFNHQQSRAIETAIKEGKLAKANIERISNELSQIVIESKVLEKSLAKVVDPERPVTMRIKGETLDVTIFPAWQEANQQCVEIEKQIAELGENAAADTTDIDAQIAECQAKIEQGEKSAAQAEAAQKAKDSVADYLAKEKSFAAEYENMERHRELTDLFVRTKVSLLSDRINTKLTVAKVKLFDVQVNGAVVETCEVTINGVPYSDLNRGGRINAGLDIINMLAEHFQFAPPVIIDNAESITSLLKTEGQQIRLVVSASDKTLRFEKGGN